MAKWKSRSDVERVFSPKNWGYASHYPERAYNADCPTLNQYESLYGEGSAAYWVEIQILGLFGSSSCRDKGIVDGVQLFCQSFAYQVGQFKLSELMLFFSRYKAGRYDDSFSTFNTRRIGNAFFKEFLTERNRELDVINRKDEQEAIERRRFIPPAGETSLSFYKKQIK